MIFGSRGGRSGQAGNPWAYPFFVFLDLRTPLSYFFILDTQYFLFLSKLSLIVSIFMDRPQFSSFMKNIHEVKKNIPFIIVFVIS